MTKSVGQHTVQQAVQAFNAQLQQGLAAFNAGDLDTYKLSLDKTGQLLNKYCQMGMAELALMLEPIWYQVLVKKIESDEHYAHSFRHHTKSLWKAGKSISPGSVPTGDPNCICFVAQNSVLLGHTEVMLLMLEDWRKRYPTLRLLFIGLTPCQPELAEKLKAIGITAITPDTNKSPLEVIRWLRNITIQESVGTAIWLSLPLWVPFIYGYQIAKKQIFWSLKFHAVHLGEEVVHIGMTKQREGNVMIHGNPWHAFQPPLVVQIKNRDEQTLNKLRSKYKDNFLFVTLAREEKFNSPRFVKTVIDILESCPNSLFLFTGREISPILKNALRDSTVSHRAIFVGWVDTDEYANFTDCFLETFPFGCAVTGMQALSHGTTVISLWETDTLPTFYFKNVSEAANFHSNWKIIDTVIEYKKAAISCYHQWEHGNFKPKKKPDFISSLDCEKYEQFYKLIAE